MKEIMTRAWEIYRTLEGDRLAKLSAALRQAWAEVKAVAKKAFENTAKVAYRTYADGTTDDCCFITFNAWNKGGHNRVYLNDYKRRTIGYIENGSFVIASNQGIATSDIDKAINIFRETYAF